jgi:hypothetical protein
MKQTIITKFLGPTNSNGARVKASCEAKVMIFAWDHSLSSQDNHSAAAMKLAKDALVWEGSFIVGALNTGYVFVPTTNPEIG